MYVVFYTKARMKYNVICMMENHLVEKITRDCVLYHGVYTYTDTENQTKLILTSNLSPGCLPERVSIVPIL